jgi:hypothetical protein
MITDLLALTKIHPVQGKILSEHIKVDLKNSTDMSPLTQGAS